MSRYTRDRRRLKRWDLLMMQHQRTILIDAINATKGNLSQASDLLGIHPKTLARLIRAADMQLKITPTIKSIACAMNPLLIEVTPDDPRTRFGSPGFLARVRSRRKGWPAVDEAAEAAGDAVAADGGAGGGVSGGDGSAGGVR